MNKICVFILLFCVITYSASTKYVFGNSLVNAGGATDTLHGFKYLLGQKYSWS